MDEIGGDPGASLFSGGLANRLDAFDQLLHRAGEKFPIVGNLLHHARLDGRGLLLALFALLLVLLVPPITERILRRYGHLQTNFRGEAIPQSMGLAIAVSASALLLFLAYLRPAVRSETSLWLTAIVGFGGLGLLDDVRGSREIRGLRGHFRAAFRRRDRQITTGFVKAVGGFGLACWLGLHLRPGSIPLALLDAAVIALCANAVNLLDLRPGRAGGTFLLCALPLLYIGFSAPRSNFGLPLLLFVFLPALRVWERDARAKVMLGDAGSNLLGASLGLAFAETNAPAAARIFFLLLLVALHLLSERFSLTQIIAKTPFLRFLDRLTGVR